MRLPLVHPDVTCNLQGKKAFHHGAVTAFAAFVSHHLALVI